MEQLVVLAGYPGVGKSVVGRKVAELTDGVIHEADVIRKELVDEPTYSGDESAMVYNELYSRSKETLTDEKTAIMDATFGLKFGRDKAEQIANQMGAELVILNVTCDEQTTKERIKNRDGVSDATIEVYETIKDSFEGFERECVEIDNSGSIENTEKQLETLFS